MARAMTSSKTDHARTGMHAGPRTSRVLSLLLAALFVGVGEARTRTGWAQIQTRALSFLKRPPVRCF